MIKVVLDANQYVSTLLKSDSNPAKILKLAEEGYFSLLISPAIVEELRRVLAYPRLKKLHGRSVQEIDRFLLKVEKIAVTTPGLLEVSAIKDDPSDNAYLACAVEGGADFIVSGDHHLTDLKLFMGIRIVTPAAFLGLFTDP